MGGAEAAAFARQYLEHQEAIVRERACIVLGWTGNSRDLAQALEAEDHVEVLWEHVYAVQQLMNRRFGITKSVAKDDGVRIRTAAEKALKSLKKYFA